MLIRCKPALPALPSASVGTDLLNQDICWISLLEQISNLLRTCTSYTFGECCFLGGVAAATPPQPCPPRRSPVRRAATPPRITAVGPRSSSACSQRRSPVRSAAAPSAAQLSHPSHSSPNQAAAPPAPPLLRRAASPHHRIPADPFAAQQPRPGPLPPPALP